MLTIVFFSEMLLRSIVPICFFFILLLSFWSSICMLDINPLLDWKVEDILLLLQMIVKFPDGFLCCEIALPWIKFYCIFLFFFAVFDALSKNILDCFYVLKHFYYFLCPFSLLCLIFQSFIDSDIIMMSKYIFRL